MSKHTSKPSSPPKPLRPFKRIDYVYKEYVRLSDRQDKYIQGSFADFKMLSAVGGLGTLAVGFVGLYAQEGKRLEGIDDEKIAWMTFVGFLSVLAVVAILTFRDLLKQSFATALSEHLRQYEHVLREQLALTGTNTFQVNVHAERWARDQHGPIAIWFQIVFALWLSVIPGLVLLRVQLASRDLAISYVVACVVLLGLRLFVGARYRRSFQIQDLPHSPPGTAIPPAA